ncbi:MAG TPA: hypothetical protein VD999_03750 [Vitreimonas sp.]|nr:hypothetical protein [Vitreimonas sp.]
MLENNAQIGLEVNKTQDLGPVLNTNLVVPRESVTGFENTPCLVFGNGVEIETVVYAKSTQENVREMADGRSVLSLHQRRGSDGEGTDVVKVHFLPTTSLAERASDPEQVAESEKWHIQIDAITGFLSMANAFTKDQIIISNGSSPDYYLFMDTNPQFAAFMRLRCGFRGTIGGTQVWIKRSEFTSEENRALMSSFLESLKERVSTVS